MKKSIIAVAVAFASIGVHAESWFEFEAGAAIVHQQHGPDGLWYWQHGTHSMKTNGAGVRAGLQFNLTSPDGFVPGVRLHADYYNFGSTDWSAAAGEDADPARSYGYNKNTHTCYNNNCGQWRNFTSHGSMQAVALTVEPFWDIGGGWKVGVEIGPALFRSTWSSTAVAMATSDRFGPAGSTEYITRAPRWQFGQIAGVSIGKGPLTLRYNYLRAPIDHNLSGTSSIAGSGQFVPSGVTGQHMVSLNYNF